MAKGKKQELSLEERLAQALVPEEERPYEVPGNWVWTNMSSICCFERGVTFPASAKNDSTSANLIACLRTANVQEQLDIRDLLYIDKSYMKNNSNKFVRVNDIIMSSANSRELVGKVSFVDYVDKQMTFGGFVLAIRAKQICSKFLFYFLRLEFVSGRFMSESTQTTNIANINTTRLGAYSFPLPPLSEQQRIVERIEFLFDKLDSAKELVQNALDSFETRKAAILHRAFTGELTAKWRKEKGISIESWYTSTLGSVLLPMKTKKPQDEYFRYIDIDSINNNIQKVDTPKILLSSNAPSRASREVGEGDTIFSMVRPYLKNIAYIDDSLSDCIASTGFYVCKPSYKIVPMFLYRFLTSDEVIMEINSHIKGDNSPSVRKVDIENTKINLPTILEQQKIVRTIDSLIEKEQRAKELCGIIDKIDLIKKAILARAFRGELGTNDPTETSALELLKEVL